MFPLEVVDAVLFVRKLPAALGAHERVVLATLVLEMPVEVVIPVVRSLKNRKFEIFEFKLGVILEANIARGGYLLFTQS